MKFRGVNLLGKWTPDEISHLRHNLEVVPEAWLEKNPYLQSIVREDVLRGAPPSAPGHSKYDPIKRAIVVYDKGVYHPSGKIDEEQFRRSVLHELAHSLLRQNKWIGDWEKETSSDKFIDDYAKTSPDEDFADTFSEFFIHPEAVKHEAAEKYDFISDRLARAQQEKVAMVNIDSFADELEKVAFKLPTGFLNKIPRGIKLGLGIGAGFGIHAHGEHEGRAIGRAEGTKATRFVAERAYKMGVMRGAVAMRRQIVSRMRSVMGAGRINRSKQ